MSEKFYIVSESELERLHSVAFSEGVVFCGEENGDDGTYDYERFKSEDNSNLSMDACCARPVPEWATPSPLLYYFWALQCFGCSYWEHWLRRVGEDEMTIDEMICALYKENFTVRDAEAITAALRAGQAIVDAIDRGDVKTLELDNAIEAWDAATREDV